MPLGQPRRKDELGVTSLGSDRPCRHKFRVFTDVSQLDSMPIAPELERHSSDWLQSVCGDIQLVAQSESHRDGRVHTMVSIWYASDRSGAYTSSLSN
jgi:hypothetical protein